MTENGAKPVKSRKGKGKENIDEGVQTLTSKSAVTPLVAETLRKKGSKLDDHDTPWSWTTLADGSVSARPAVFTADGNYFFSVVGTSVRIYSVATGKVVSTLSSTSVSSSSSRLARGDGHTDTITATIVNPENPFQLLTASLDGTIKIWDYLDAVLLQTIHVGRPISHMCAHEKFKGHVFVALLTKQGTGQNNSSFDRGNTLIYRVSLKPKEKKTSKAPRSSEVISVGKSRAAVGMSISPSGSWLVVIAGHKAYVAMTSSLESGFTKFVSPERLTCLAFHPSEDYFATGDEQGQIRLWYCLNNQLSFKTAGGEKRAQTTTMHWHAHAVSSLSFTPNGAYLLSGGEESVLVIWQLQTGKREYVPRLGSPILQVSVRSNSTDGEEYLVGLSDGSYIFIDAGTLSISRTISRLKLDPKGVVGRPTNLHVPLAIHEKSSTLILPAPHPSSLQIYSPNTSSLLAELEVSPSNRISRKDQKPIEASHVEFAVVSSTGEWLATIDKRDNDEEFTEEVYLKIWHWESSKWVLSTRIDRPHASHAVTAIGFSPVQGEQGAILMTAGLDKQVKTWCLRSFDEKKGKNDGFWTARSSFSFQETTPVDARWSPDGSLLAVCFDRQVALYDPHTNSLLDCLVTPDAKHTSFINFIGRSGRHLLVSGRNNAALWDLVSRTVSWHLHSSLEITQVVAHSTDDIFAVVVQPFAEDETLRISKVMLLRPESSEPFETQSLPFRFRAMSWYSSDKGSRTLLGITYSWNVVLCGDKPDLTMEFDDIPREITEGSILPKRTLFQDIFGQSAFLDTSVSNNKARALATATRIEDRGGRSSVSVFDTPAYLAPPLESLFSTIMDDFLSTTVDQDISPGETIIETGGEEDAMIVDADTPPSVALNRDVGDDEIKRLTTLFRAQTIQNTPDIGNAMNGMVKIPNGSASSPRSSTLHQNGIKKATAHGGASSVTHSPAPSSPTTVGKKRKKSTA